MTRDIVEIVGEYASEDPARWGRLASDVQWRRLTLLLLREILVELRRLNGKCSKQEGEE
jgi:hypothetical protein